MESLEAYYQMLLAEMEHLTLCPETAATSNGGPKAAPGDPSPGAKVKALTASPGKGGIRFVAFGAPRMDASMAGIASSPSPFDAGLIPES